jgi:hypothetical protein
METVMEGASAGRWKTVVSSLIAGCFLMAVVLVGLYWGTIARSSSTGDNKQRTIYARGEFSPLVMDKTEEEVYQTMGKPDTTSQDSDAHYWHYRNCTRDPVSKQADTDVQLVFRKGKVAAVNY